LKIQKINKNNFEIVQAICLDPSIDEKSREFMNESMNSKLSWILKMIPRGLKLYIAYEKPKPIKIHYKWVGEMLHSDLAINKQVPMGSLEAMPIEYALEPVEGKNSLFINCMWILPPFWAAGVGKSLLKEFFLDAKKIGGGSIIAYNKIKWFGTSIEYMPSKFFEKYGFEEVDRYEERILLHRDFGANQTPKLLKPKPYFFNKKDQFKIDILYNSQCPWSGYMINTIRNEVVKYSNVNLNLINTDNRKRIKKYGLSRGIFINGKPILNRMADWEEIKPLLERTFKNP
jgi:GNAT superfamily N-acetyltransferase